VRRHFKTFLTPQKSAFMTDEQKIRAIFEEMATKGFVII